MSHPPRRLKALAMLAMVASLAACASGARQGAMTAPLDAAHIIDRSSPFYAALTVDKVSGGHDTNPLLASQVANGDFATALAQSLQLNTMLDTTPATTPARYGVSATVQALQQPFFGLNMTVTAVVHYAVTPPMGPAVFDQTVTTSYTAKMGDAMLGIERLRLANEGAMRANISAFISALATTKLAAAPGS